MKVLLASTYYGMPTLPDGGYGGMEKVNWFLARELQRKGHSVTLLASPGTIPPDDVAYRPYTHHPTGDGPDIAADALWATSAGFDIIHDSSHEHRIARAVGGKCVCTFHNPNPRNGAPNPVVLSNFQKREDGCHYGDAKVVYNGVPGDYYRYMPMKQLYVTCVSVMADYKGVIESVKAAMLAGVKIELAGTNHDVKYWSRLSEYIDGDGVVWNGEVSGSFKAGLMGRACGVVLFAKWPEPGSLVGPEAMAYGTALIGSNRGCLPEYIVDGVTGYICNDETALVGAIATSHRIRPNKCRARWEEMFTAERMGRGYIEVYERVMSGETW